MPNAETVLMGMHRLTQIHDRSLSWLGVGGIDFAFFHNLSI
jgi:hypothetical protein